MRIYTFGYVLVLAFTFLPSCTQPTLDINADCSIAEAAFIREPNKVTGFVTNIGSRHSVNGYINLQVPRQNFELHIVSSYEGSGVINIGKTKKPVVLAVSAYEPGLWTITENPGARLAKIIVFGYDEQNIDANIPKDDILKCPSRTYSGFGDWSAINGNTRYMPEPYIEALKLTQTLTGLAESSYQSGYNAGLNFSIPPDPNSFVEQDTILTASQPILIRAISALDSLERYKDVTRSYAPELKATADILIQAIDTGSLPVLHVDHKAGPRHGAEDLQPLFSIEDIPTIKGSGFISCDKPKAKGLIVTGTPKHYGNTAIIGSKLKDHTECSYNNNIHITGAGKDHIDDSWGNDIINAGPDNDIIEAGWGRDIIVFEKGWGDDVLHKTCHDKSLSPADQKRLLWKNKYYNFIVFGPGIDSEKLRRTSKNVIVYPPSGDRLTLADTCFSFAFADGISQIDTLEDIPLRDKNGSNQ